MSYQIFTDTLQSDYPICILSLRLIKADLEKYYITPFGLDPSAFIAMDMFAHPGKKKTPVADMKQYILEELVPEWKALGVKYIVCTNSDYFKVLTKAAKVDASVGFVLDCVFGPWKVIYVPPSQQIFFDPAKVKEKIDIGMQSIIAFEEQRYIPPGANIMEFAEYPKTTAEIKVWLDKLMQMDVPLAVDIEAFSLKHHDAGIGTICFAWSKTEGIAFPVDYVPIEGAESAPYGVQVRNQELRDLLRAFFENYKQKIRYHGISYDAYVLIYQLFMTDILDTEGTLVGMETMLKNWDDTLLITYLATNSCAGNKLSLKEQAQEYAGNWAQSDIEDITKIPLDKLLKYNLIDGLSTQYVYEKNHPIMVADEQEELYEGLFKQATADIIQMQLTGMPINIKRVAEVKVILQADEAQALNEIASTSLVARIEAKMNAEWVDKRNSELVKKRVTLADANCKFNPNSGPQLQSLLFDELKLPVLDFTKTKQPATGMETLTNLINHTTDPEVITFLKAMVNYSAVNKILTSFIPAFEKAVLGKDGWHYLFGSFKLGGTVSGRLSSREPNLQNLPATKSKYAKLIKSCFEAPPGWLFAGLDYNSLEDRISALTTKDPNKLKVYTDGYDGHSMRAFAYFGDQMPDIVDTVESINTIAEKTSKYGPLRQDSKAPTFALTYQGTYKTLMKNCGFPIEKALSVEKRYHDLYVVSDQWVKTKIDMACREGYITAAFGLRVRTPMLHQVILGNRKTPFEAEAEGRTAGNALGQSWCLLNNRSSAEFMAKVRQSEFRTSIRPCAQVHDAFYMLMKDDIESLSFTNKYLVEAVQWQDHPDIWHDQVKLNGEVSVFYPTWADEIVIPNNISDDEIVEVVTKAMAPKKPKP
jgi:DNA polymerase-1